MESINEQNCSGKTSWIKKIRAFESLKQKFRKNLKAQKN